MWGFLGLVAFLSITIVVVVLFVRDRKYEKKSVAETMGKDVWDDLAKEREEGLARAQKFRDELNKAKKRVTPLFTPKR